MTIVKIAETVMAVKIVLIVPVLWIVFGALIVTTVITVMLVTDVTIVKTYLTVTIITTMNHKLNIIQSYDPAFLLLQMNDNSHCTNCV